MKHIDKIGIEIRHLRYFVVLAEELNFTRAANRLHISQPPLSQQIRALEEFVGSPLFKRTSRRVELTAAGQTLLTDARLILGDMANAVDRVRSIDKYHHGQISIGLSGSHFQQPLTGVIAQYIDAFPDVSVVLHQLRPATQLEELRRGRIDLSVSRTPVDDGTLISELLWDDRIVVALPQGHFLASQVHLELGDLKAEKFIMLQLESSAYARHIYDCCIQAGFTPNVVQWLSEVPAIVSLISAGIGIGLVPISSALAEPAIVDMVPLEGEVPYSSVFAVKRRETSSPIIDEIVNLLRQAANR